LEHPNQQREWAEINRLVETFNGTKSPDQDAHSPESFFLETSKEEAARKMGDVFWLPLPRAYKIFCYAYSALFGIPAFTSEAVSRQADRFSYKRLPLTIRSTSGFILDGFGYNRRTQRHRKEIYLPGPVIRSVHGNNAKQNKMRISNPAMAYFGYHLIRAAEQFTTPTQYENFDNLCQQHYDYVGSFFRTDGYPFPSNRKQADDFSTQTDTSLAHDTYAEYWHNIIHAAEELGTTLDLEHLAHFLPKRTSAFFRQTVL
jgi:hypothetical protein